MRTSPPDTVRQCNFHPKISFPSFPKGKWCGSYPWITLRESVPIPGGEHHREVDATSDEIPQGFAIVYLRTNRGGGDLDAQFISNGQSAQRINAARTDVYATDEELHSFEGGRSRHHDGAIEHLQRHQSCSSRRGGDPRASGENIPEEKRTEHSNKLYPSPKTVARKDIFFP